jgi:hypothetical protein
VFIYGLFDPETDQLRYVGKTKDVAARLDQHMREKTRYTSYKNNWLKSIKTVPVIKVLAESTANEVDSDEQFYIEYFRALGAKLTNQTNGGTGGNTLLYLDTDTLRKRADKIGAASKARKSYLNATRAMQRPVVCVDTGDTFPDLKTASLWVTPKGQAGHLGVAIRKGRRFHGKTFQFIDKAVA